MPHHPQELLQAGLLTGLAFPASLEPGEVELQVGIEARVDGFYQQFGLHGRLHVARRQADPDELTTAALALLIRAIPAAKRRTLLSQIPDLAARAVQAQAEPLAFRTEARRLLRGLKHRVGVRWKATPTYKPRG